MSTTKYSKEFKLDAISLVLEQGYTQTDAAKSLGIDRKLLHVWIKTHKNDTEESFRGQGKLSEEQLEIRRLGEEVKRLTMEKEILKKATAFFAKEMK
jgi:transposase